METPDEKLIPPCLKAQMDGPWFLGPATFMKTPALSEPPELDQWKPDAAVVSARPGTIRRPTGCSASWITGTRSATVAEGNVIEWSPTMTSGTIGREATS